MTRRADRDEAPATIEEALDKAPLPPWPAPHGVPAAPAARLGAMSAAELRAEADAAEARERAQAEARLAREAEYERVQRECAAIAAEYQPVYEEIAAAVDRLGLGEYARKLEEAEGEAMARGSAVAPEDGAVTVRDHLRGYRGERYRRLLDLCRSDRAPLD